MGAEQRRRIIGQRLMWHHGGFLRGLFRFVIDGFVGFSAERNNVGFNVILFGVGIGASIEGPSSWGLLGLGLRFNSPFGDCMFSAYVPNYSKSIA